MLRILLTILLPVVLPLLAYYLYAKHFRPQTSPSAPPEVLEAAARRDRVVAWSLLAIGVVAVIGLFALGFSRGVPPGTKLISPQYQDGRIVPSHPVEPTQ